MFITFDFLTFEFLLRFENVMFEYGFGLFGWVCWMGLVDIDSMILVLHVFMFESWML